MSLPEKGLEQEPDEKASKGSKGENYNCFREVTEDIQRIIFIIWTSTLLFTLVCLRNPARKISLKPVIHLGWVTRLLTAFKTHLKCWEAPGSCLVAFMRKLFEDQIWLSCLRALVAHGDEDGLLLLSHSPQCFWQMTLPTLVMLVILQWFRKPLSNLHELDLIIF